MRVCATEDALVTVRLCKPQLTGPRHTSRRPEKLRGCGDANRFFGLLQVAVKLSIRVTQNRTVREVVVRNLVSRGSDLGDHLRMTQGPVTDQKECCRSVMPFQNFQDLDCENRVRPIIEGKRDQWMRGANSINELRRESLQRAQDTERLDPKHNEPNANEHTDRQE